MRVVPGAYQEGESSIGVYVQEDETSRHWARVAAGGALLAGGVLLLTGQRRAGLLAAAGGTALALLDQQEALRAWWKVLPYYVSEAERIVNKAQQTVEQITSQGERLRRVLSGRQTM